MNNRFIGDTLASFETILQDRINDLCYDEIHEQFQRLVKEYLEGGTYEFDVKVSITKVAPPVKEVKPYFMVFRCEDGVWVDAFGSYDRDEAIEELSADPWNYEFVLAQTDGTHEDLIVKLNSLNNGDWHARWTKN